MKITFKLTDLGKLPLLLLFTFLQCWCWFSIPAEAQIQTYVSPQPCTATLDANLLRKKPTPASSDVITADSISPTKLTIPSLWWAKEQFAGKLLNNWFAYPNERRVDLVVNRQLWANLDYIDRYSFVNELGTVAKDYGYNVRVFNELTTCLASYTCNASTAQSNCAIWLETSTEDSLRAQPNNLLQSP